MPDERKIDEVEVFRAAALFYAKAIPDYTRWHLGEDPTVKERREVFNAMIEIAIGEAREMRRQVLAQAKKHPRGGR